MRKMMLCGAVLMFVSLGVVAQMPGAPNQPGSTQNPNGLPGTNGANGANGTMGSGTGAGGMAGAMVQGPGTSAEDDQATRDRMFLRKAAEGGMAEVKLGELASQKGASNEVKTFGQKMVTDHTALNNEMKPIAESMGVMLPKKIKKEDQEEYDKLSALSGDDFDKEYLAYMVKDHHDDIREFRREDMTVQDPTLKAAVDKGLGVIRQHTMMVDKLAKDKGLVVPERR